jgi:hypothetical protein
MQQTKSAPAGSRILAKSLAITLLFSVTGQAQTIAMPGPGIAKVRFQTSQLFTFFGNPKLGVPAGRAMTGATEMINGYVIVPFGDNAEVGPGGWYFFDASKLPAQLPVVRILRSTQDLREQNVICFRRDPNGKIYAATMAKAGIQFHDWTDAPRTATELNYLRLPGVQQVPYEGPWWLSWEGKYMYAGGVSAGLYIVDAEDPANPKVVKVIPNSQVGNFRAASCVGVGNLLYLGEQDIGNGQSTMEISDPLNPKLLALHNDQMAASYSHLPIGNMLIVGGRTQGFKVFDLSVDSKITLLGRLAEASGIAYMRFQDGYAHGGSNGFAVNGNNQGGEGYWKIDIRDPRNPKKAHHIDTHLNAGGVPLLANKNYHLDWGVPVGNFVFASDDMGFGSGVFAHTEDPDETAPRVNMVVPRTGAVKQALSSRIGVTFTDQVAPESITPENFSVMPVGSDQPLVGWYASQQGVAHFTPREPLLPGTTYRIVVRQGGVKDYAGNPTDTVFESRFTTGGGSSSNLAAIPIASMTAQATSQNSGNEAAKGIDGNQATLWHTEYQTPSALPQEFTLTFDKTYNLGRFTYTPRQDGNSNGNITQYEIWASQDGVNFTKVTEGNWTSDPSSKEVTLSTTAKAVRLRALAGTGGFAAAAEIKVEYLVQTAVSPSERKAPHGRFHPGTRIYQGLRNILGRHIGPPSR